MQFPIVIIGALDAKSLEIMYAVPLSNAYKLKSGYKYRARQFILNLIYLIKTIETYLEPIKKP